MNLVRHTEFDITIDPTSRIPTTTWLLVDHMNRDGVFTSIRIQIRGNIIRKGIVAIWIMTHKLSVDIDFGIHVNSTKFQAYLLIEVLVFQTEGLAIPSIPTV